MLGEERIAILGLRGSGKTTFLSVLNLALTQKNSPWRIRPVGDSSIRTLSQLQENLFVQGRYPEGTQVEDSIIFLVEKEAKLLGLQPGASFHIYIADVPGEAVKGRSGSPIYHEFYEQTLKGCSGIIFLLDPQEYWLNDSIDKNIDAYFPLFSSILAEIKEQAREDVFIAFCITKLDAILPANSDFASHGVLKDIEILAERIIGRNTKNLIDNHFDSDHISWFPVSSTGYLTEGDQKATQFFIKEESDGSKRYSIKKPSLLTPIGIAEALEWILNSVTDYSEDSRIEKTRGKKYSEMIRSIRKLFDR